MKRFAIWTVLVASLVSLTACHWNHHHHNNFASASETSEVSRAA
ncbi:MAG TPA: hypothetical protein VIB79_24880 [Candidatus Binatia bacterium]